MTPEETRTFRLAAELTLTELESTTELSRGAVSGLAETVIRMADEINRLRDWLNEVDMVITTTERGFLEPLMVHTMIGEALAGEAVPS